MKILIADPISFIGHLDYNYGLYRVLSRDNDCSFISNETTRMKLIEKGVPENVFPATYDDNVSISSLAKKYKNKIRYHWEYRKNLLKIYSLIDSHAQEYDAVLLTSIDVYSFAFYSKKLHGNYLVMDHAIGDIEAKYFYRAAWKIINPAVKLIVFEDFIREMVNRVLPNRAVFTIRHPLSIWKFPITNKNNSSTGINIYCPSASNNLQFIRQIEASEIPEDMHLLVKVGGNCVPVNKRGLQEYNHRIPEEEYINDIASADYILLPYNDAYNYRYSGVLLEAIQLNRKILILNNNTLRHYADIFPDHVFLFDTIGRMYEQAMQHRNLNCPPCDLSEYEDSTIADTIIKSIQAR